MPYTPILATLGYVLSPDRSRVLLVHRNARTHDAHIGKHNGLGGKLEADKDIVTGLRRELREEVSVHPSNSQLFERADPDALIDPTACRSYADAEEQRLDQRLAEESAAERH